jgi:hypothetical protein
MSKHPNTDHDEAYNRAHWHEGEAWLGIESMRRARRKAPIEVKSGTIANNDKTTTATGKGHR